MEKAASSTSAISQVFLKYYHVVSLPWAPPSRVSFVQTRVKNRFCHRSMSWERFTPLNWISPLPGINFQEKGFSRAQSGLTPPSSPGRWGST